MSEILRERLADGRELSLVANYVGEEKDSPQDVTDLFHSGKHPIVLPPGDFIYRGDGLDTDVPYLIGAGRAATSLRIENEVHLFSLSRSFVSGQVSGVSIKGGKGVFCQTLVSKNVGVEGMHFVDCSFWDYTGECIASLSDDVAYIRVNRCTFTGRKTSVGVSLRGKYLAGCSISDSAFRWNRTHVTLGDGGNGVVISGNRFFRLFKTTPELFATDIMVLGRKDSAVNSGSGYQVVNNFFSSENIQSHDRRVVYGEGIIVNHYYSGNVWSSGTPGNPPLIYSKTPDVRSLGMVDNMLQGSAPEYIVKFDSFDPANPLTNRNIFRDFRSQSYYGGGKVRLSNFDGVGKIYDGQGIIA